MSGGAAEPVAAAADAGAVRDHAPGLERAFDRPPEEGAYRVERVEGEVPAFVRGSYYLNGPARFVRGSTRYRHWLDGDGMVCALHFGADGVDLVNRWVRSAKLEAEEEAGRALFRTFGTAFEGDRLKHGIGLESPVNVSVYPFAGKLLAFGEQGLPYELDPRTLETLGVHDFGRRLNPISPFAAHPCFDPASGEMLNFGISFAADRPCLNLYRFDAEGGLVYRRRLPLDAPRSVHDFGLSPRFAVFYLSPYLLDMERLAEPGATLLEALSWRPEAGTKLLLADRETGAAAAEIELDTGYCLHLVDCSEENGRLHVDVIEKRRPIYDQYQIPDLFVEPRGARPVRYTVDPAAGELLARRELDEPRLADFPTVDPRRAGAPQPHFWCLAIAASAEPGRKFFDRLLRLDWQAGGTVDAHASPPGRLLAGEPVFIPDPDDPSRGAILCQELTPETRTSAFLLFDAFDLSSGPLARLELRSPIHLGFHAVWRPEEA